MAASGASPLSAGPATGSYERHRPEETLLYTTLQAHWKTFLRQLDAVTEAPALPAFVVSEVEAFLRCGILAHGSFWRGVATAGGAGPSRFPASARSQTEMLERAFVAVDTTTARDHL
jgi:hypothetical protein